MQTVVTELVPDVVIVETVQEDIGNFGDETGGKLGTVGADTGGEIGIVGAETGGEAGGLQIVDTEVLPEVTIVEYMHEDAG